MSDSELREPIVSEFDVKAPIEDVWEAVSTEEGLMNWFPIFAKVKPGPGGSIFYSWGSEIEGEATIEIWDPPNHLKSAWMAGPTKMLDEFYLEAKGDGETRVRIVSSGFTKDAAWDAMYDSVTRGWQFEGYGLKHYLERFAGKKRFVIQSLRKLTFPIPEAWEKIMGPKGICGEGGSVAGLKPGDTFKWTMASGDPLEGRVVIHNSPQDFAAVITNLNDAYLRVRADHPCDGGELNDLHLWLSTYELPETEMKALESRMDAMLDAIVPRAAAPASS